MAYNENERRILARPRGYGKTTDLIDMCVDKLKEGKDVLFVTHLSSSKKRVIDIFKQEGFLDETISPRDHKLVVVTKDQYTNKTYWYGPRGRFLEEDTFKVYNEALVEFRYFDAISITGIAE